MRSLIFLLLLFIGLQLTSCHVALTFPPARQPNYDFLDNVRTGGPCGVPPLGMSVTALQCGHNNTVTNIILFIVVGNNDDMVTTFATGATFNLTFHLAYPHRVREMHCTI